jgi:hypothetical protein
MATRTRTHLLRRAAVTAAFGVLLLPAGAGAATAQASKAKKAKTPVITRVSPMNTTIGQTLTIKGRYFQRGRNKNSVVFKRDGGKAVFIKADVGTAKLVKVKLTDKLVASLATRNGAAVPTRFRVRVLSKKLGKKFTTARLSPVIGPFVPPVPVEQRAAAAAGDCDGDGVTNGSESDDDGDLLEDSLESLIKTDQCKADTDGDQVNDGYEYQSARDLNDDEYREPQNILPAPEKRPYPNPLFDDAKVDYDGDSLTLNEEYSLWVAYRDHAGLEPLIYSDGNQYSVYDRRSDGRRPGAPRHDPFAKHVDFLNWARGDNYANVWIRGSVYDIRDFNQNGTVSSSPEPGYAFSEQYYYDYDSDDKLSDDERDEDADGLTNFDEAHGRMLYDYWTACYKKEAGFGITYAGTNLVDPDTDGDGVRDGADDQDHDDIPNMMELSRNAASGRTVITSCNDEFAPTDSSPQRGRVNPYNPCLPYIDARTCTRHPGVAGSAAPFDNSPNYLVLN